MLRGFNSGTASSVLDTVAEYLAKKLPRPSDCYGFSMSDFECNQDYKKLSMLAMLTSNAVRQTARCQGWKSVAESGGLVEETENRRWSMGRY